MKNNDIMIFIKPHLRNLEKNRELITNKLFSLMKEIQKFILPYKHDKHTNDSDRVSYDVTRRGKNSQIYPIL